MDDEGTDGRAGTEPGPDPAFKRLPPRMMPEQMVETKAVDRPDPAVHAGTETKVQIRTAGAG
jgi:hypothetical protein